MLCCRVADRAPRTAPYHPRQRPLNADLLLPSRWTFFLTHASIAACRLDFCARSDINNTVYTKSFPRVFLRAGWTGLVDILLGHYGIELEEGPIIIFVAVVPVAIDVLFKYWIFIGLNRISPGAVVTIKQIDRH